MDFTDRPSCVGCAGCDLRTGTTPDCQDPTALRGWRLVLASSGLFLLPLLLAAAGAAFAGKSEGAQALGGIIGLGLGLTVAAVLAKVVARHQKGTKSA